MQKFITVRTVHKIDAEIRIEAIAYMISAGNGTKIVFDGADALYTEEPAGAIAGRIEGLRDRMG